MHNKKRLLFILKYRETGDDYGDCGDYNSWNFNPQLKKHLSSGLYNSALLVDTMLRQNGVDSRLVTVVDNNDIDREVTRHNPTHCIIEAFWVVPEKFDELKKLHPHVKWIVRDHSKPEFLAQEGMAFGWIAGYLKRHVALGCNSPDAVTDMKMYAGSLGYSPHLIEYLPNYYHVHDTYTRMHFPYHRYKTTKEIHIGCFGAIRPFKNQINQALAALEFAREMHASLYFHINGDRIETGGTPIIKNLREIFKEHPKHRLIEHPWMKHHNFKRLIHSMDLTMQVSFTETFNIVSADSVDMGVPVVGSKEIPWMPAALQADPNCVSDILMHIRKTWIDLPWKVLLDFERKGLKSYVHDAKHVWLERFKE